MDPCSNPLSILYIQFRISVCFFVSCHFLRTSCTILTYSSGTHLFPKHYLHYLFFVASEKKRVQVRITFCLGSMIAVESEANAGSVVDISDMVLLLDIVNN